VGAAIAAILKYKKEHGNTNIPKVDPHKHLHIWIIHAKTAPKKIIQEGCGNPRFTMPHLLPLRKLGIIDLPTGFKLKEAPTKPKATENKKANAATAAPPKANAPIAAFFLRPKAAQKKKKSARVTSTPTRFIS
jgi:hypothetical protein